MSQTTETKEPVLVGGWTPYHDLSPEDKKVFDEALHGIIGVHYTPKKVATQLVNGTNYRFLCSATIQPLNTIWEVIISVYMPIAGRPYVTAIERI